MRDWKTIPAAGALAAANLLAAASPAAAISIMNLDWDDQPDFLDDYLDVGDQATTEDGLLTMTFTSLEVSDGTSNSLLDEDGIYFSRDPNVDDIVSLTFVLSAPARLIGFDIDWSDSDNGSFWIEGPGGTTAANEFWDDSLPPGTYWAFDMGPVDFFAAGVTYTLNHDLSAIPVEFAGEQFWDTVQIDELHWEVVPLPAPAAMLAAGMAALGGLGALRRRIARG